MKGTSRQPEFQLKLIAHACSAGQHSAPRLAAAKSASSVADNSRFLKRYFPACSRSVKAIQLGTFSRFCPSRACIDVQQRLC
jgi:hypothetical protein